MLKVWMSHGDKVTELPSGFKLMASTPACPIAGMADEARRFYGVQFHPEVTHTRQGTRLLHRFVREIFFHRRKFLRGVAVSAFKNELSKSEVDEVLASQELGPTARTEELSVERLLDLCEAFRERLAGTVNRQ